MSGGNLSYDDLKLEISERSISQLPGLVAHIIRLCAVKPVFVDKEAMLRFVAKAWDQAETAPKRYRPGDSHPYDPSP